MANRVVRYFDALSSGFGKAWNRFWFTPSDPFTLCAIRVPTGLVAIYLHATLGFDLVRYFAAGGWLPVETVAQLEGNLTGADPTGAYGTLSYLNFLSTPGELWTAHLIGLAVLVLFTAGLFTRLTSVLALIVVLSDIHRAPMLTTQAEPILTMLLFYCCLGPAGAYFSLDRLLRRRRSPSAANLLHPADRDGDRSTAATIAVRLVQVHLAMIYGVMGLSKLWASTWWDGTAMWWLMARPDTRLVDLTWLHNLEVFRYRSFLVDFWTHAQVYFELGFPLLIWHRLGRPLLLAVAVLMWVPLGLIIDRIPFALLMLIAGLAFVPSEWLRSWLRRGTQPAVQAVSSNAP